MWRLVLILISVCQAHAQVITTTAGTDLNHLSGVPALNSPIGHIGGIAVDNLGNIYASSSGFNDVLRISPDGVLTVAAGNGHAGFSGDEGFATAASLSNPTGIAVDSAGALYIADRKNHRIRKVIGGIITTVAGTGSAAFSGDGGPATRASLVDPMHLAVDSTGNVYFSDGNRIRKISGGIINTIAGDGTNGYSGDDGPAIRASLNFPQGLAVDSAGSLYIADFSNSRVRKIAGGVITTVAGNGGQGSSGDGGPATFAALSYPVGVAVDGAGRLYIAEGAYTTLVFGDAVPCAPSATIPFGVPAVQSGRIRRVADGVITTVAGMGTPGFSGDGGNATQALLNSPSSLAVNSTGTIYIADEGNGRIRRVAGGVINTVAGNGAFSFSGDGGPASSALLDRVPSVAVDASGNMYFADYGNHRVRKIAGGRITTVAGTGAAGFSGDGGSATSASLNSPTGVALDAAGNLYIVDSGNQRVRKVTANTIATVAGNGTAGYCGDGGPPLSAMLYNPTSVAVDSAGALFIAETGSQRIRRVSGGTVTTFAGNFIKGFSGDGDAATKASLNLVQRDEQGIPYGSILAVDSTGALYIADSGNERVRRVSAGTINTVAGSGSPAYSGDGRPAIEMSINHPAAVAFDSTGIMYIADTRNHRIRRVRTDGIITTLAGNGNPGFLGDGGLADAASLSSPVSLALDPAGNLYFSDFDNNRIREVLANKVRYQTSTVSLSFSASAGAAPPASQTISLLSPVAGLSFVASAGASWISVSPAAGTMPTTVQVTVDPTALPAGTYNGNITVVSSNALQPATVIAVAFTVEAATPAALDVDTGSIAFASSTGSAPLSQTLAVRNSGGGSLNFTATVSTSAGGSWLSISPAAGASTPSSPASLTVTATPRSLVPGTYTGTIQIAASGKSVSIPVTLSVSAPAASILLSQTAMNFNVVSRGGVPLPQSFGILNTGQGALNWTATAVTLSGGNWLRISPTSGVVARPDLDVSLVDVSIDPTGLDQGTYYGRIQVSAVAVNTPQLVTVILNVLPPGSTLGTQIFPAGLIFTSLAGENPGAQDIQIANSTSTSNDYLSAMIGAGLDYLPKNAVVRPDRPSTLRVYPDFAGVKPGSQQRATITLQFSDGSPSRTIDVLLVRAPAGGASANATAGRDQAPGAGSGLCAPLQVVLRSSDLSQGVLLATVGKGTSIEVRVSDSCGTNIDPSQNSLVTARFGDSSSVPLAHVGQGIWQGTWKPLTAGPAAFVVYAVAGQDNNTYGGQSRAIAADVRDPAPVAPPPTVSARGVVHSASDLAGVPIAPGGLITLYGLNLADQSGPSGLPLPKQFNGTQVLLGIQSLPILYTSEKQLNVQVPYAVPVNTQYQLTVQRGDTLSAPQGLVIAAAEPGIFTTNQTGTGQGAIQKSDQVTLAQPGTPVSTGDTVVIYCTGLGTVTPSVTEGQPAPVAEPLARTDVIPSVTIGGKPAAVTFSGLTPGLAGLYQINAVVPADIAPGDAVPVSVSVAGQTSPVVTIAVR